MRTYGLWILVLAVLALLAIQAPAQAGVLTGDTIGMQYFFPDLSTLYENDGSTVAPGTLSSQGIFEVLIGDSTITVPGFGDYAGTGNYWNSAAFNGFVLTDETNSPITSVTVDPSTTMPGFTAANVSWTGNQIFVNWQSLTLDGSVTLDLNGAGAVPEPSTWLLLGTSLAGLLAWRRKRRA